MKSITEPPVQFNIPQHFKALFTKKILMLILLILTIVPINLVNRSESNEVHAAQIGPLVIGVAEWRQESGPFVDVQENAYTTLMQILQSANLAEVSVVKLPVSLSNANAAEQVAADFNVDMVLWGWYDPIAIRSYVDLADSTDENGLTNSLDAFLKRGGSTQAILVLKRLSELEYNQTGLYFCVPRWTP